MRRAFGFVLCIAALGVTHPATAGFFDDLGKGVLKELAPQPEPAEEQKAPAESKKKDKTGLIIGGVTDLLAGASEVPYETERVIGESLALEAFSRFGQPVPDEALQKYVNLVGSAVARNSTRPEISYRFVVVQSELYNAFACPGGIVFVSEQLLRSLDDEAELAAVLAHEVGHVAYRHALQSIRRAQFLSGVGKLTAAGMKGKKGRQFQSMIGDLQTVLFDKGLDKNMEFEADLAAVDTTYRTGYDPAGMLRVVEMLERRQSAASGGWFSTHPPLDQRLEKIRAQLARYPDSDTLARVPERFREHRRNL